MCVKVYNNSPMLYYNNTNNNSQQFNNNHNMNIIDISVPAGGYLKNFF